METLKLKINAGGSLIMVDFGLLFVGEVGLDSNSLLTLPGSGSGVLYVCLGTVGNVVRPLVVNTSDGVHYDAYLLGGMPIDVEIVDSEDVLDMLDEEIRRDVRGETDPLIEMFAKMTLDKERG